MDISITLSYAMNKRLKMLSVRVSEEEMSRVQQVAELVKKKHPYVEQADVIRELLGLVDTGLISQEIRKQLLPTPDAKVKRLKSGAG